MMRKAGAGEWAFRLALLVLLSIIAFYIYQSWLAVTEFVTLGKNPPSLKDGEGELGDFIGDYNDLFKQFLEFFL